MKLFFRRPAKRRSALKAAMRLSLPAIGLVVASWFGVRAMRGD